MGKPKADVYRILKAPHITEKAAALAQEGKYIFKVYSGANKIEIKKAIEGFYGVKVEKVNIVHIMPKRRRLGRTQGWKGGLKMGFKKAIVTLVKGEKIEVMPR
ncbi:MAG: 50S ribosomal protein L23 [Candidatus Portnoybacteria bacterium RIFCSPLOWO2_12_FULL_39_9]|uniref:Large ribosomal subunit protein uL23 n=1 Tax=Candidatus Portnoybacteria bacterium RIFCSPHIGHO2_12_FULL_38_9 TaxID=1801997 RepID=A0A1G2FGV4_9BACT|nr:MAG: 50S ribosomal protein L23 [Candidatus Portnoybacteria bacterium RBG_13_40_8]OGZ36148.1 MAG: 50S ribosomal protein L23 [Candidatus Portnoybacteria bacterium RIFCSPHIGHO2_02_FULL_39_12]OGZ37295.1 MAG: 50S ribosomal protein L23 [Candidatus Portnoybacteria bacterium RIFCSPHIGHO2_12_FULL_38_9]OGZ39003.1 MAG: 50S ribosomal protein L23 [Candidatus Portnoybacteria bacterium RIFCSPLOWO2_01_FULL_38_39]OGZ40673.1 MAG: 50S ribosomal protein L23 [Candidatus Portnoybacteria bacterium RIFCSPLOWO2_12_F